MQRKLLFLACFFVSAVAFAQEYPFVHYTPKDGLVNSRVRNAYQDSKGRLYFITYGGLSVYNGAQFRNYTMQNGLISDLVNDVLEIGNDSFLVAVNSCGLNILVHGQMKKIDITGDHCPVVNSFLKSDNGIIYAATDDGLYKLSHNRFEKLATSLPGKNEVVQYLGMIAEYKDFLIFTTNDLKNYTGLFLYNKKSNSITDAMPGQYVTSLRKDITNLIWLSTAHEIYNLDTSALVTGKLVLTQPYRLFSKIREIGPGSIVFNRLNEPFIFSANKGIFRLRREGTTLHIVLPEQSGFVMQNFLVDREGILWICHDGNGVYKLPTTKLRSGITYSGKEKSVISFVRTNSPDSCWIYTADSRLILHTPASTKTFSIASPRILYTLFYNHKYLYATFQHKLYMAPMPKNGETKIRFKQILTIPDTSGFGSRFVNDPYGNMIIFESRNICVLQNDKLLFTYPQDNYDLIEGMHIDRNSQLWVISRSSGLKVFSLHPENPSRYLQKKYQFIKEFENASPRCITVDKNQLLWVGTRSNGLMAFEYKDNRLIKRYHFQSENGLTDNFVTSLTFDNENNVLIGTQTGLDRLIRNKDSTYRIENITKSNNIFTYINYVWTDTTNNGFALTSVGKVLQVEAVQNATPNYEPQLLVEELKVNGKTVPHFTAPVRLTYLQRNITLSVAAPAFKDEKQIKYSYQLLGGDNSEWSDTTSVSEINLLNLSPGTYTLQIRSFFFSTAYTPKEVSFAFVILPPWWQSWWFRTGVGIFGIGMLIAAIRLYYQGKLERQKTILEKQQAVERERTRIATDMHDDLGAGLSRIKFLSETIGIKKQKRESIEDEITSIRNYSHEMIDKMGEIVWALNQKNDSLNDLLSYTRSYAVEYLTQNGLRCTVETTDEFSTVLVTGEFRRNIYLAVKEALHNIVKHAAAGQVCISFRVNHELVITIKDDGRGFDPTRNRPHSNGLINMKKRMRDIGGSFEIKNMEGTYVHLSVPLTL